MNPYYFILGIIVVLALFNVATLIWVQALQRRLQLRDQMVASTQRDVGTLKTEAHTIALAETLVGLEKTSRQNVQKALEEAASVFNRDLATTTLKITGQMESGATELIEQELGQYRQTLTNLREAATASLGKINDAIDEQRASLTADLQSEIKKQQAETMKKFEAKLSDVVSSFLVESLGNDVDLGAQSQYLFKMLDEHKADLVKAVTGEV